MLLLHQLIINPSTHPLSSSILPSSTAFLLTELNKINSNTIFNRYNLILISISLHSFMLCFKEEIVSFSISAFLWWKLLTRHWFYAVCSQRIASFFLQQDESVKKKKQQIPICGLIADICVSAEGLRCGANHNIFLGERSRPAGSSLGILNERSCWSSLARGGGGLFSSLNAAVTNWEWKCFHLMMIFYPFFSRMQERDLQGMCRRALLLTVCIVSLWGQLTGASSHRSHIGRQPCVRVCVCVI